MLCWRVGCLDIFWVCCVLLVCYVKWCWWWICYWGWFWSFSCFVFFLLGFWCLGLGILEVEGCWFWFWGRLYLGLLVLCFFVLRLLVLVFCLLFWGRLWCCFCLMGRRLVGCCDSFYLGWIVWWWYCFLFCFVCWVW